jgi:hypothetical protein
MASERQIAANRRNARKSTGPRGWAGKSRASRNAYRHGLSVSVGASATLAPQLDKLARKIAGNAINAITLERAREIAQAELDLARVRRAKVALIERTRAFAATDRAQVSVSRADGDLKATSERGSATMSEPTDCAPMMPPQDSEQDPNRSAEAIRRVLPELRKLDRYERRAAARRDRAVLDLPKK